MDLLAVSIILIALAAVLLALASRGSDASSQRRKDAHLAEAATAKHPLREAERADRNRTGDRW